MTKKYMWINQRAAAVAMDATVGPQARAVIENLYTLIDDAETYGYQQAMSESQNAWMEGYDAGIAAATSTEQPELPEGFIGTDYQDDSGCYYSGDSGDETTYDPEMLEKSPGLPPMQEQNQRPTNPFAWS